ncbi:PQQ-binding-like beta-propeller repeat protein [Dehalococcoidia bacterium]|nr:PQQ-binding-like beta-propeller repeat protein [Dehalococcoidia bacterium]
MGLFDELFGEKNKLCEKVKLLWSYETGDTVRSIAIGDGYVAVGSKDGKVYLFDYSGKLLWSYEAGSLVNSVAIGDGYVAAGSIDKKIYLFDYSGKLHWNYEAGDGVWSVAIGDGYVAVSGGDDMKVYLFDYSGKLLWSYETGGWVFSVAIGSGYVAAGSEDKKVYLFDYSGKLLWSYEAGDWVLSVAIGDGYVAAGSKDNKAYLFDYSGKLLGSYEAGDSVYWVAIRDGYMAAGSVDDKAYLFDYSGKLLWSCEAGDWVYWVAIRDGYMGVKSGDKKVYLFLIPSVLIKSAESAIEDAKRFGCDIAEPEELLNQARSALSAGNYREGITIAKNVIEQSKTLKAIAKPKITLDLTEHNFRPNYWEKVDIIVRNTGTAHAKAISLTFSKEVEVKGLKELNLNIGDEQRLTITLKPKDVGEIPVEVHIRYEDLGGKAYDTTSEFILSVGEAETIKEQVINISAGGDMILTRPTISLSGAGEISSIKRCPECKHEAEKDARFCPECGTRL